MNTERTERLIGAQGVDALGAARVLLFGLGGVGSYVAEALARAGIGALTLVDKDIVEESNVNRQLIALQSTIGQDKVAVAAARCRDINPEINVMAIKDCFMPESALDFSDYNYVVDAVDMVTAKIEIIRRAKAAGVPVISSMGTGNKTHPEKLALADISRTSVCPLAKVMRRELKARGLARVPVVYSTEVPLVRCTPPGSISTVPSCAGLLIASKVINDLTGQ